MSATFRPPDYVADDVGEEDDDFEEELRAEMVEKGLIDAE